jgi:hypothetical protein
MVEGDGNAPANGCSAANEEKLPSHRQVFLPDPGLQRQRINAIGTNRNLSGPVSALEPPGCQMKDVYDATLPWWRAAMRRKLLWSVERESVVIAKIQVRTHLSIGISVPIHR